jgi:hypothetical protein
MDLELSIVSQVFIIQRLGTDYPGVYGKNAQDLQMTTIDPHDFSQPSLQVDFKWLGLGTLGFADFYEPKIQVWNNVSFADNYYQTVPDPNAPLEDLDFTPAGRPLSKLIGPDANPRQTSQLPQYPGLNFPKDAANQFKGKPDEQIFLGGFENDDYAPQTNLLPTSRARFTKNALLTPVATHGRALGTAQTRCGSCAYKRHRSHSGVFMAPSWSIYG